MKTITENYTGKVLATANKGFSVKKTVTKIQKTLSDKGLEIEVETAKTGSTYIDFFVDNAAATLGYYCYSVRVSNHSKRGWDIDEINFENSKFAQNYKENRTSGESFHIINTETLHQFLNIIA